MIINLASFCRVPCRKRASQVALVVRNSPANAGDIRDEGSTPGLGRSPERGHGNPLQYSCLENPMDRGAWWATVQGVTETTECVHTHTLHSPRHHSQKRLSSRMHTHARTHARTHTPHLRASALLFLMSAFCRAFHMLCPLLPGFRIYIFQRGLWQGHYLKWAHLFPS